MFDIGLQEMIVIGVLALLVFGPSKLPELGRMVGRTLREFRRASDEFRSTVETNLNFHDIDPPARDRDSGLHRPTRRRLGHDGVRRGGDRAAVAVATRRRARPTWRSTPSRSARSATAGSFTAATAAGSAAFRSSTACT
jgi:Tat protein translocase TatB subunit